MKRIAAPLLVLVLLAVLAPLAQAQGEARYESDLYYIILAEHGPNWKSQNTEDWAKKKMQAIAGLKNQIGEGNIIIAGLVVDDLAADFVMIASVKKESELREVLENAPLIKEGFYKVRTLAWHAPKGLKLVPTPLKK